MTDAAQVALITGCSSVAVSVITGIIASFAKRAAERAEALSHETKVAVDGRMTEMLELTRKLATETATKSERSRGEEMARAVKDAGKPTQMLRPEVSRQENDK